MRTWRLELQRFAGERTLPATPRRRQKARAAGQVARSGELSAAVGFLAAVALLAARGPGAFAAYANWAATSWAQAPPATLDVTGTMAVLAQGAWVLARTIGPLLLVAAGAALCAGVAQTGLVLSLQPLVPSLQRLNPVQGLARLFSRRALIELGKAVLKVGVLALVVYGPCRALLGLLVGGGSGAAATAAAVYRTGLAVLTRTALVLLASGAIDFAYQRHELESSLRMTRDDVRQEQREMEGDPAFRARRRRRQREMARRRMLSDVRRADVVLANPTHVAVALRYDSATMDSPLVVAKGAELMAERIKAVARAAGVMIVENPPLARSLHAGVRVGGQIPPALYKAVAEVLAFVWRVRGRSA